MIVLDTNILIRADLGKHVRRLLETYSGHRIRFYAPEVAYADAAKYLPALLVTRSPVVALRNIPSKPPNHGLMNRNTFLKGVTSAALCGVSESMLALSHDSNRKDRHAPDKPKSPRAIGMWEFSWIERCWDDAGALAQISRCGCI